MGFNYFWVVLIITTGSQMTISFVTQGMATLAPFFVSDLGLTRAQVGFLGGAVNVGMAFTSLLVGVLVDRLGEKAVLIAGGILTGVTVLIASRAGSFTTLALLLLVAGFWTASSTPAGSKGIMTWFPVKWRGFALGFRQTGLPLGGALSAFILPALAMLYGWRGAMVGAGLIAFAGVLLVLVFYREKPQEKNHDRGAAWGGGEFPKLLRNTGLWLITVTALALVGIQFTVVTYLELFYHEVLGYPIRFASYMLALAQLSGMFSRIFWGAVSDRFFWGSRKKPFLLLALFISFMCLTMFFVQPGIPGWLVALLSCLVGFTTIGWNGLFIAMVSELAGRDLAGTALGISLTVIQLGVLFIPPLFGFVVDNTGSYRNGWLMLVGISLAGAYLMSRVWEKKAEPTV